MATADLNSLKQDLNRRMEGALETLRREFAGLRTGRAHPGLLDPVRVVAYGNEMPLNQLATVGTPEPRMLTVQVWDKSMISAVDKAIRDSGLGLNPAVDGMLIRVPIPQLTTERRNELAKLAHKYAEGAKISVRGVRRDGMEQIKGHEKKHEIGEDLAKNWADEVQKLTDQFIKKVDEVLVDKEKDIKQV
jgi:ribosome recycling factor